MARLRAVLFDWDGTLCDSTAQNFEVYGDVFRHFGVAFVPWEEFRREFEADFYAYYAKKGIPASRFPEVDAVWTAAFLKRQKGIALAAGAAETISSLSARGLKLGIVTNTSVHRILDEIRQHGLQPHFQSVVTLEDVPALKPSPAGILHALKKMDVRAHEAVYVGDMAEDVIAGKRAGVITAAVACGIHSKERLAREKPDHLLEEVKQVLELF